MSNNYPTTNGVEDAEALTFPEMRRISLSTQVSHRGRVFTVTFEGYTLDEAVDLLDRRGCPPVEGRVAWSERRNRNDGDEQPPQASPPVCPVHKREMKPMKYPSKQGHQYHCTAKMGDDWCQERA